MGLVQFDLQSYFKNEIWIKQNKLEARWCDLNLWEGDIYHVFLIQMSFLRHLSFECQNYLIPLYESSFCPQLQLRVSRLSR